ncbi:DUF4159 domain-containing protein [uncultured Albimonas sp.]|uniref:DUF4159 domain-containing protein n=1 Tax=uncultured Albimonas sp. TaxID=1331701 RepID=UPI0030ED64B2
MLSIGSIAFLNPWLLLALAVLPALWWLLRATPPAPRRISFPGVRLLLGLQDPERMPDRTPWWLLLLRLLAVAAAILAFARPVENPQREFGGDGSLVVALDGGWASAPDWEARRERALEALEQAERAGRPVVVVNLADPLPGGQPPAARPAGDWRGALEAMAPRPWAPDRDAFADAVEALDGTLDGFETLWLTDGLSHGDSGDLGELLAEAGPLTVVGPDRLALALRPPRLDDGALVATALRADPDAGPRSVTAAAIGRGPEGAERRLAVAEAAFPEGEATVDLAFDLPLELRNQVERVAILGEPSAGGVALADDAVRRKRVGLISGEDDAGSRPLTSSLHFLRKALQPTAEVVEGSLSEIIDSRPDAIILADLGVMTDDQRAALTAWMEEGGLLVRFAGARTARAETEALRDAASGGPTGEDPLLPVRLRAGGRAVGGAMSWEAPQGIRPFGEASVFSGLPVPGDIDVRRQVLAQPGPDLAERTQAALADGTPLVTAADRGDGRVVLFHVTANAEWSSLPLSGLFVQMLERLALAASVSPDATLEQMEGAIWTPVTILDGYGRPADPGRLRGVQGARLAEARPGPDAPPGVWRSGERSVAINLSDAETELTPAGTPPAAARVESMTRAVERDYKGALLAAALMLLALDAVAALAVAGRLRLPRRAAAGIALALAAGLIAAPPAAWAQSAGERAVRDPGSSPADAKALSATLDTVLAYVLTGDPEVDRVSEAGLRGLSRVLTSRTAVEPADPIGVDLETDELAFYPLLYWPISAEMPTPSDAAYARLNEFTRTGGMIVFDTRDAHLASGFGTGTPEGRALRRLAAPLDLPPLEPAPADHVLTRTFYLLQSYPGRWRGGEVWLEAAADASETDGTPFRHLNDGVSPVVIGAADWASAWAVDDDGQFVVPVGRDGGRQREMAFRFGVNLVMYVLTGSYKSDQVHVPALLERLGN